MDHRLVARRLAVGALPLCPRRSSGQYALDDYGLEFGKVLCLLYRYARQRQTRVLDTRS